MDRAYLDTSFVIALASVNDAHHDRAKALAERLRSDHVRMITTRAVLIEIGDGLSGIKYRGGAIVLIEALEADPSVDIIEIEPDLFHHALDLFRHRTDKEWGLTECLGFAVMSDQGITEALTADRHFVRAGFRALLRESQ